MTRKDYELIAAAVRAARVLELQGEAAFPAIVECLENALANQNERFNRNTFRMACGLPMRVGAVR